MRSPYSRPMHRGRGFFGVISTATLLVANAQAQPAEPEPETRPDAETRAVQERATQPIESLSDRFDQLLGRPGGLTAEQVGQRSALTSPEANVREKEVAIAAARVDEAIVALIPRLTLTARYTRYSPLDNPSFGPGGQGSLVIDPAGTTGPIAPGAPFVGAPLSAFSFPVLLNEYWLQAGLTIPLSDYIVRGRAGIGAAKLTRRAARLEAQATRLQAAANGKLAYYEWIRARLQQVVAEQTFEQTRAQLSVVRRLVAGGRLSRADLLQAQAQLANAELLVERAKHLSELNEERLRTSMHDESKRPYSIGERLDPRTGGPRARPTLEEAYGEALRQRVELRALEEQTSSLKARVRVNRAEGYPKVELFGNAYYINPNPRIVPQQEEFRATWDVGAQVIWSPNDLGSSSTRTRQLEANVAQVRAQHQQTRDQVRTEVLQALQTWREADLALATSARALESAEAAYRTRRQLFDAGRASPIEVVDTQTELLRAKLEVINARVGVKVAEVRFEHAVGRDAPRVR